MSSPSRRSFFAVPSLLAASISTRADVPKFTPKANTRVLGANDRINVGFIGTGMQFHSLLNRAFHGRKAEKNDFEFAAVCDVWEPRVKHAQEVTKAEKTYRDYREILSRPDIDAVVIVVPDQWHYLMASQACECGKDVYLEKPMTYTIDEAQKLTDTVESTKRILQVGGSGPSTRMYWQVNDYIKAGKMGKVLWGLISYNRNTRTGMWDYPMPGVGDKSWPDAKVTKENLDWNMWLGPAKKRAYSDERYFRWRKYWDYSGGNATDLLYHRLGAMSSMVGFDFPTRAMAAGGIYAQKNREVPDTYMTMIEYPGEYAINMISCMANERSVPLTVYGNWGTVEVSDPMPIPGAASTLRRGNSVMTRKLTATIRAERSFLKEFKEANDGKEEVVLQSEPSTDSVDDWLDCIRTRKSPIYNAKRGYQVMTGIAMGVESYRTGKVMAFDPTTRKVLPAPPPHREFVPKNA